MHPYLSAPYVGLATTFFAGPAVAVSLLDQEKGYRVVRSWGRSMLEPFGVRVEIKRPERMPEGPVVVMANHESYLDVPALIWKMPYMLRFVAKKQLKYIPIFGWGMNALGHIFVDRGNREQAVQSLDMAAAQIRAGTSIAVFPEGTRSRPGELLPFKKGGFVLAVKSGVPIVPVSIAGSGDVLPKGAKFIREGTIELRIHEPVDTRQYTLENKELLMDAVRAAMQSDLEGKPAR